MSWVDATMQYSMVWSVLMDVFVQLLSCVMGHIPMMLFKIPCGSSQLILPKVLWHKYKKHEGLVLSMQVQSSFALYRDCTENFIQ